MRREDDKVTQWIRKNWCPTDDPSIVANTILARMVNKPSSLERIGYQFRGFDANHFQSVMSDKGTWGSAYIVSTNGRAMPKHEYIAGLLEHMFDRFAGATLCAGTPCLGVAHAAIQGAQGMGSFMSAQVVADLKNTPWHPLYHAKDWNNWSAHGPGSLRGLGWYFGRTVTPIVYGEHIHHVWDELPSNLKALVQCRQNLQNCLCEFDKFMRVSQGTGRSKRKYHGS